MLVLSTKTLQKLTGTGGQADGQTNLCIGRLRLQKRQQFSQKMSASNACMLASFSMSNISIVKNWREKRGSGQRLALLMFSMGGGGCHGT